MNPRLLSSFLLVLGFWWTVIAAWWGVADPEVNRQAVLRLAHLMPWISWQVPQHASVLNAWWLQVQTLKWWSLPLMGVTLLTAGVGGGLTWLWAWRQNQERQARVQRDGEFRGIRLSLGRIPKPLTPPRRELAIKKDNPVFAGIPQAYLDLLQDCIGLVAANTGYAGKGAEPGSLLPRCTEAVQAALITAAQPASWANGTALQAIFGVAIELGKATSWIKGDDGEWLCTKPEPRESARILATLSSWWDLPASERTGLYLAVKFQGRAGDLPEMPRDPLAVALARHLLSPQPQTPATIGAAPRSSAPIPNVVVKPAGSVVSTPAEEITPSREDALVAPKETPEPALASVTPTAIVTAADPSADPEREVLEIFTRECAFFPFQSHGTSREAVPVGWCIQSRVYFTEQRLASRLYEKLPQHLKDKYPVKAGSARYSPLTGLLIKLFEKNGWLVTEQIGIKLKAKEALWTIEAGKGTFQSIMIVDFPPEIASRLPASSSYPIRVIKPQFQKPGDVSPEEILSAFTRPKASGKTNP